MCYFHTVTENDLYIFLIFFGISGLVLFVLTLLNKITFFYDTKDFVCSFSQILVPAITVGTIMSTFESIESIQAFLFELSLFSKVLLSAAILAIFFGVVYAIRYSFTISVSTNGKLLGIVVYLYKLIFASILSVAIVGKFQDLVDTKNSTFATRTAAFVFLGLFSWLLSKMINGKTIELIKSEEVNYGET